MKSTAGRFAACAARLRRTVEKKRSLLFNCGDYNAASTITIHKKREKIPMEILSPAGSPEALRAAVCAGADAVYLGFGQFNARRGAKNFTRDEFASAVGSRPSRRASAYTLVTV